MFKQLCALTLTIAFAFSAFAIDLEDARRNNKVTELPSGYLRSNSPDTKTFVDDINNKRRRAYEEIAKKNGLPVDQVAGQAAQKIQEKLRSK